MFMKKLSTIVLGILLASCHSDSVDDEKPVISITSPTNGQSFTAGQTVTVAATVSDNDEIHEVHLHVINIVTGVHEILFEEHTDAKTYTLNKTFTAKAGANYQVLLEADDHSGNQASAEVRVTGN